MADDLTDAVADRLEVVLDGARTVYRGAVPTNPTYPYIVVRSNVGETLTGRLSGGVDGRTPVAWLTSVAKRDDAQEAAREASWGSTHAVDALMGYRIPFGAASWLPEHLSSLPVQRDDDLKPAVVMFSVDQLLIPYVP